MTRANSRPTDSFSIGEMSRRTGVNIETIRYYERIGLLRPPSRSGGGYRQYGPDDARRLSFLRHARDLGFSLDQVRALLRLADERNRSCAEARDLAAAHLAEVRAKLGNLRKMERALKDMIAMCADGTLPACPIIEALADGPAPGPVPRRV